MHRSYASNERLTPPAVRGGIGIAALAGLVLCIAGAIFWPASFWPGYLVAAAFWISVSLGCLGIALLHALTGGRWGWGISRELHAALAPLFVSLPFLAPLLL